MAAFRGSTIYMPYTRVKLNLNQIYRFLFVLGRNKKSNCEYDLFAMMGVSNKKVTENIKQHKDVSFFLVLLSKTPYFCV